MTLHTNFRWGFTGAPQQMLVKDGIVVERGPDLQVQGRFEEQVDHGGKLLIPGYIDSHCHILPTGLDLLKLNLGGAKSCEEALDLLWDRHREHREGWLLATHYDHNRYGRHLTRGELDGISIERPILLRHVSGHAGVANSGALAAGGVKEDVSDFQGGSFGRDPGGRLNGVLLENAFGRVSEAIPKPDLDACVHAIVEAGRSMRRWGICSASDMMTGFADLFAELEAYRTAAEQGCPISTCLYVEWRHLFGPSKVAPGRFANMVNSLDRKRCKVAGVKIFADGAISAGTAAMHDPYPTAEGGTGTLMYPPEELKAMVHQAAAAGWQVAVHSIGDRSTDLVLDAIETAAEPARHRIEHAMLLSDAQIERVARIGCHVTFQPEFLLRFGETYTRQLGVDRASRLLRSRSALDAGVRLSFSSDRPVTSGNPWDGIAGGSNRPKGFDPAENCTRIEAVEAYTVRAAQANEDDKWMGTLLPGTKAEFQVIDSDGL